MLMVNLLQEDIALAGMLIVWLWYMYNMSICIRYTKSMFYLHLAIVFGSVPKYPFRKAAHCQQLTLTPWKRKKRKHSPPGINAVAYITLVIGRKPSSCRSDSNVNSMAGSQAVIMASAYTLRSTARSFSVDCSAWHCTPRQVPNSRKARRRLTFRSR